MGEREHDLIEAYRAVSTRLHNPLEADIEAAVAFAAAANAQGQSHLGLAVLEPLATPQCRYARVWQGLGLAYRDSQDMEMALNALERAQTLDNKDPTTAFAYAQVLFETARPATDAFTIARALSPNNPTLMRNSAAALSAEGQHDAAEALLLDILTREPQWLDGHKTLAALRVASGRGEIFDASFLDAIKACPQSLSLRLAHIHLLSTARAWDNVRAIIEQAHADFGPQRGLEIARAHLLSEAGDPKGDDPALFEKFTDLEDAGLDIARLRQALRIGDPRRAARIGESYISTPAASLFWPYVSLAWRLLGEGRAEWLDGAPPLIREFDLGLGPPDLANLRDCLQAMHTSQAPFLEQSVNGGTQTGGHLFFRPNSEIQAIRSKIVQAVEDYIAQLGDTIEGHPLLSPPRGNPIAFEGSWSVRLRGGGYHSTHTHPKGWISSALYVDVPESTDIGPKPAGWISFGEGPPELKLGLKPCMQIEPKAGTLVLFPSTLWHKTVPFERGERLTIAFDVKMPSVRLQV
jgi:tetratricopeptide (TPR) repeat protein